MTLSKAMRLWQYRFGGIETLENSGASRPAFGDDEVLVQCEAAGVGVGIPLNGRRICERVQYQAVFPLVWDPMAHGHW